MTSTDSPEVVPTTPRTLAAPPRDAAESAQDVFWLIDEDNRLLYLSPSYEEVWGRSLKSAFESKLAFLEGVHPEDRARTAEHVARFPRTRDIEYRIVRPDGEIRWIHDRTFTARNPCGGAALLGGVAEDVTDRRKLGQDYRMQAQMLASVQQAMIATDLSGTIASWNRYAESLYGWTAAEAVGQNVAKLIFAEGDAGYPGRLLPDCLEPGTRVDRERQIRRKDGTIIWVSVSAAPVTDENGHVTHIVGTSVDITERLRLEQQFRQSQKMEAVGRLAGGVAHDFNNLLTVIKGHAEFLSRALPDEGESREDIDQISKAAERAAGLTRQLLAFSRQQMMEKQVLDPNALLLDLEKMLGRLIGEDIILNVSLQSGIPPVLADAGQVEQAVMNLVVNARDAMPEGGDLRITTRAVTVAAEDAAMYSEASAGDYVSIAVSDTGSGIPADMLAKIFEPFFTTKAAGHGTGLGLATVYGIAQQSGGFVGVTSSLRNGSTFTLYLPAVAHDGTADKAKRVTPVSTRAQKLILLVEDQDEVRAVARRILTNHGYRVIEAKNGVDALAVMQGIDPGVDLVLTDAVMPQMGGPDLIRALRVRQPDLPVVMASGYTDHELMSYGANELNVPFLHKPFRAEDLLKIVRSSLDGTAN